MGLMQIRCLVIQSFIAAVFDLLWVIRQTDRQLIAHILYTIIHSDCKVIPCRGTAIAYRNRTAEPVTAYGRPGPVITVHGHPGAIIGGRISIRITVVEIDIVVITGKSISLTVYAVVSKGINQIITDAGNLWAAWLNICICYG
jgi:hypothetical protein